MLSKSISLPDISFHRFVNWLNDKIILCGLLTRLLDFIYLSMQVLLIFLLFSQDVGVIVVDNVWFYGDDQKMISLGTGTVVEIIEYEDDLVKVSFEERIGKIHKGVLIDLRSAIAEQKLFVFARGYFDDGAYSKAASLLELFITFFEKSQHLAEVLYYYGLSNEQIAKGLTPADSLPGFIFNGNYNTWHYSGEAYERVLEEFPENIYASRAAYRLLNVTRAKNLPWRDSLRLIQGELEMWHEFISKYNDTEEYVLALLEVGYLNRVLFEITENSDYKRDAVKVFQEIFDKYPKNHKEFIQIGNIFTSFSDFDYAIKAYEIVLKKDRFNMHTIYNTKIQLLEISKKIKNLFGK